MADGVVHSLAGAPSSRRAADLLGRADAELLASQFSPEPWERFSHAHLAALRAGAALVASRGLPGGRRSPRSVWGMVGVVAPELGRWAEHFAEAARLRSAVEAGRFDVVSSARADEALADAEDFVDAVRATLDADADADSGTEADFGTGTGTGTGTGVRAGAVAGVARTAHRAPRTLTVRAS